MLLFYIYISGIIIYELTGKIIIRIWSIAVIRC